MSPWRSLLVATLLSACANDVVDDGDVVDILPGGKSDDSCEWTREIVDEQIGRSRGQHSTLRMDRDGFAHVVYEDRQADDPYHQGEVAVRYATNRSGEWVSTVVSTTCRLMAGELEYRPLGSRANSNFDLDADGRAYVACSDGHELRLLDNASGEWRETTIRTYADAYAECREREGYVSNEEWSQCRSDHQRIGSYGRHAALRLDSQGTPHVVYTGYRDVPYGSPLHWLEYATREGDRWRTEILAGPTKDIDLAIDGNDRIHIAAQQGGLTQGAILSYFTNATGEWRATLLASANHYTSDMGNFVSAAVSKSGRFHAVHFDNTFYGDRGHTSALSYVRKGNGQPLVSELKRDGTTRAYAPDVALDAEENLHVVYHDEGTLAYQVVKGDLAYEPVSVDHGGVGSHASLALGGGTIHVTYFDEGEARLKYARWTCSQ